MTILRRVFAGICDLLKELSDQNAYARHLSAHAREHSPSEWRRFADERFRAKYQRPKCC